MATTLELIRPPAFILTHFQSHPFALRYICRACSARNFVSKDRQWLHFAFDDNLHRAVCSGAKLPPLP